MTRKFFVDGDTVNLYFDTNKDVSEWEYSAIYDLFNTKAFEEEGFELLEDLDEYNPTFIVKFKYDDDHNKMQEEVTKIVDLIEKEMIEVFKNIEGKEDEYKED